MNGTYRGVRTQPAKGEGGGRHGAVLGYTWLVCSDTVAPKKKIGWVGMAHAINELGRVHHPIQG